MLETFGWAEPAGQTVRKLAVVGFTTVRLNSTADAPAGTAPPVTCRLNAAVEEILPRWPPSDDLVSRIRTGLIGWNTVSVCGRNGSVAGTACGVGETPPAALALACSARAERPTTAVAAITFHVQRFIRTSLMDNRCQSG